MNIRCILSIIAIFSATLCYTTIKDDLFDPPSIDKEEADPQPEAQAPVRKIKPHFAGVRRTAQKTEKKKRPSLKIKNKWVKSGTHPKPEKREPVKPKEVELPPHLPYLED
jgi:hypothetical protein